MFTTLSRVGMGSTEVAVRYALTKLIRDGKPISPEAVATIADCHPRTVSRVFKVWRMRGELRMEGTPRSGYTYTLLIEPTHRSNKDDG